MEKQEELKLWKEHLKELNPVIKEQLEWLEKGKVEASVNPNCPEKLRSVAERLVEIQNTVGEYQRNQISKEDIERIKYISKILKLSFDDVVKLAVSNSRYVSKSAIEAKGVVGFVLEIQSVYDKFYKTHGVFPINAMSAESKRACRNFKTDVSLKEKIEALIEVFLPELQGIIDRDFNIISQSKYELTENEVKFLIDYFNSMAESENIDKCFELANQESFLACCKLLSKANLSLDDFLKTYTNLDYTKCYSAEIVPAVKQMVLSYKERFDTTTRIREYDPYLRSKIDAAERYVGKYTIRDLLNYWQIPNDNQMDGRNSLTLIELGRRQDYVIEKLKELYPDGVIEEEFIKKHPEMYEELKLLSNRLYQCGIDEFLRKFGFVRIRSHAQSAENVIYLSSRDILRYGFSQMNPNDLDECNISTLSPSSYFGVYNKLVSQKMDSLGLFEKHSKQKEE